LEVRAEEIPARMLPGASRELATRVFEELMARGIGPTEVETGFTPRRLAPAEQDLLGGYGLGITNLVARATAQAAELDSAELRAGGERLLTLIADRRPGAAIGPQPGSLGGARLWILPNPSGLNAHWTLDAIAAEFAALRAAEG